MTDGKSEVHLSLSAKEFQWLNELAWQNRLTRSEVLRLLIRDAAKRAGLPDPDKPAGNADPGDGSDRADHTGG